MNDDHDDVCEFCGRSGGPHPPCVAAGERESRAAEAAWVERHQLVERPAPDARFPGAKRVFEGPRWFLLRDGSVGSHGRIVSKEPPHRATVLGSAHGLEDWLWGYEQAALGRRHDVRLLAVRDPSAAKRLLRDLLVEVPEPLTCPMLLRGVCLWRVLPELRSAVESGALELQILS
jgi:hypothetical protein